MNDLAGIIWAHRSDTTLGELTRPRNTCSLPFGGRYRLVDFMLSNYINAGIGDVGLIVHESYQSLLDHVGNGKDWDLSRKQGGLRILPPFSSVRRGGGEYRGSIEALSAAESYLTNLREKYVILAWGDVAANLPVAEIFQQHLTQNADITMVCTPATSKAKSRNYVSLDADGRVEDFLSYSPNPVDYLRSMQIYILSKSLLLEMVEYCISHNRFSFSRDGILPRLGSLKVMPYIHKGFSTQFRSISDYFVHSMELLDPAVRKDLFNPARPIITKDHTFASTYYAPEGKTGNSLIADGCHLAGTVSGSILSRGVVVEPGATVTNCVLMQGTVVRSGVTLSHVITDKNAEITKNRRLMGHTTAPLVIPKNSVV